MNEMPRFLVIAGLAESLLGFRGPLLRALQAKGLEVHVVAPGLKVGTPIRYQLETQGLVAHDVCMARAGTNPLMDLRTLWHLFRIIRRVKPRWVLGYTIKPVVYGSIAARLAGIRNRFALITGLGYAFQGQRTKTRAIVERLYAVSLRGVDKTFFQNPDDERLFRRKDLLSRAARTCVVNGSGVDLNEFALVPAPSGPPVFLLIGRLLGDKGVREYAQAARRVKRLHPEVRFDLVGWIDENPSSIRQTELNEWVEEGTLNFLGRLSDVRPALAACSAFVLPSYREGTPRTVLEAMAMGKPVITTDAPGCRETVRHEWNGYLVPVQSVDALEQAMLKLIENPVLREQMGQRARELTEAKYDVHKVNAVMLQEMGIA